MQKLDAKQQVRKILAAQARNRFYHFVLQSFDLVGAGRQLRTNWHIEYLCDVIQERIMRLNAGLPVKDLIVNVPPGSLKSTIFGKCLFPWAILHNPSFSHMGASYSESLAERDGRQARDIIMSPWYMEAFNNEEYQRKHGFRPEIKRDQNQKVNYETTHGGKRYSVGIKGTITGEHFHLITLDDPNNTTSAESEAERERVNIVLDETLPTRFKNKESKCLIIIQQRLNDRDASGYSLSKDPDGSRFDHICIPAELNDNVRPESLREKYIDGLFFPAEFTREYLDEQKSGANMGPTKYGSQFLQQTAPAQGNMIKGSYFRWYTPGKIPISKVNFDVDTAFGEDSQKMKKAGKTDYSVILAHTKHEGNLYLLNRSRNKLESPQWRRHLVEFVMACGYTSESRIRIEPKANGQSQIHEIKQGIDLNGERQRLNVIPDVTKKGGKEVMVENALPKLETGCVHLPGTIEPRPDIGCSNPVPITLTSGEKFTMYAPDWVAEFIDECLKFPKAEHDDQVDTLTQAIRNELRVSIFG